MLTGNFRYDSSSTLDGSSSALLVENLGIDDKNVWGGWSQVLDNQQFHAGTPIAVVSRNPDQIDLFAVATDGYVWTAYWSGQWNGWGQVLDKQQSHAGTPIAVVSRNPDQIDLFGVAPDDHVWTAYWNGQ